MLSEPKTLEQKALESLEPGTLLACASVVSQMGFQHFDLCQDTRLGVEARKAHRFVAMNCETAARRILSLSGADEKTVTEQIEKIAQGIQAYRNQIASRAAAQPVPENKLQ
jgi:hypothetical protein